jgi:hypothetical protein
MGQLILDAILKELSTNPDRIFSILDRIINLFEKHPDLVTTLTNKLK